VFVPDRKPYWTTSEMAQLNVPGSVQCPSLQQLTGLHLPTDMLGRDVPIPSRPTNRVLHVW
jgi:hypothetical protein